MLCHSWLICLHYFVIELFCEGWRCKGIWLKCSAWEAGCPGLSTNYKQCMDLMGQKWYVQVLITNRGIIKPEQLDVCASIMVYIYLDTNRVRVKMVNEEDGNISLYWSMSLNLGMDTSALTASLTTLMLFSLGFMRMCLCVGSYTGKRCSQGFSEWAWNFQLLL